MAKWHNTYFDPLVNQYVGELGSAKYILDGENGNPCTRGYHEFWMHKGTLMGSLGALEERVVYDDYPTKPSSYEGEVEPAPEITEHDEHPLQNVAVIQGSILGFLFKTVEKI